MMSVERQKKQAEWLLVFRELPEPIECHVEQRIVVESPIVDVLFI